MDDSVIQGQIEQAIKVGERNLEIIDLTRKHCSHAVISKSPFGGTGTIELETGLPIGIQRIRCPYATQGGSDSQNLERIALDFWESNCRGCAHRDPRGVPNLTTLGEDRLAAREASEEQEASARAVRDAAREERASARASRVAAEPPATRAFVALLDGVDIESPDKRAKALLDEALAAPERCTPAAAQVLLDVARTTHSNTLMKALDYLEQDGRIPTDELLALATETLARVPSRVVAAIVVRLRDHLLPQQLRPCVPNLALLGGQVEEPFGGIDAYGEGLALAAELELEVLIAEISRRLRGEAGSHDRGRIAFATKALILLRPETAATLANPLVDATAFDDARSPFLGSSGPGVSNGLSAALRADPVTVDAIFVERVHQLDIPRRKMVFGAYDGLFRDRGDHEEFSDELATTAIDSVFERISGDWGDDLRDPAIETLDLISRWFPELLTNRIDAVFGLMLSEVAVEATEPTGAVLLGPTNPLEAIQQSNEEWMHQARVSKLRDVVATLSHRAPEQTLDAVEAALENLSLADQSSTDDLHGNLISLLGGIGRQAEFAGRVLPRLVTTSLSQNIILRTRAIEALGEVASVGNRRLPDDVLALLTIWLRDPYRGPHKAAVGAIRDGFPVADQALVDVLLVLIALADAYVVEANSSDFLHELLVQTWRLSRRAEDGVRRTVQRACLERSEHLAIYDLERFLTSTAVRSATDLNPVLRGERILQVMADEETILDPNRRDEVLKRELRDLSTTALSELTENLLAVAKLQAHHEAVRSLTSVEFLQRARAWESAAEFSLEVLESIPQTPEARGRRASAQAVNAACTVEVLVAHGDFPGVQAALLKWQEALDEREEFESGQSSAWENL